MTTIDQQLFELMCRDPAVPDWFEPDMAGITRMEKPEMAVRQNSYDHPVGEPDIKRYQDRMCEYFRLEEAAMLEKKKRTLSQWPSAYARMVMEAAK